MIRRCRRRICLFLLLLWGAVLLGGCSLPFSKDTPEDGKLRVTATLFPQYDFARAIAGDRADVVLLIPPGLDSHSYEPSPADLISINRSDLFFYTGEYMESWAGDLIAGLESDTVQVVDVSQGLTLISEEEEHGHDHEEESLFGHHHEYDPHIWTSPVMAKTMVENIEKAFCEKDPEGASYYHANAQAYLRELDALDQEFRQIVAQGNRREILFGGHFALYYFVREYGLSYESAYDSCASETEPSVRAVKHIIDEIREEDIPVIYYEELSEPKVAQAIAEETGTKMLLFHSCHNVSKDEWEAGATYLSLMRQNAENLKEGLS